MALPPLNLSSTNSALSSGEDPAQAYVRAAETERREREALRSLRIKNDERYMNMEFYKEATNGNSNTHFARLCNNVVDGVSPEVVDAVKIFSRIKEAQELLNPESMSGRQKEAAVSDLGDRKEWQENFDRTVKRLLVDFDLSDQPRCRLNHLDRMHSWFVENGAKQARKVQPGPNFLTAQRDERMPPGSTQGFTGMSPTSMQLAGAYISRTSPSSRRSP